MSTYESVFIAAPTVAPDTMDGLVASFEEVIAGQGGVLSNTIRWGRRTLAYEIKKFREGIYTIFEYEGDGATVKELERRLRLNDSVLKFITVRTDRKKKLINKGTASRQAKQEARAKRKAQKAQPDKRSKN